MTNNPSDYDAERYADHDDLLSRYVEGTATKDEVAQLEALLLADAQFADHASRWCLMHRQITELMTEDALHEMLDRYVQGSPGPPKSVFSTAAKSSANASDSSLAADATPAPRKRRPIFTFMSVAAAIAAIGVSAALWLRDEPPAGDPLQVDVTQNNGTPVGEAIIATLTRLADGKWAPDAERFQPGDHLVVGSRVALQSGMAKVTFECGAEVVLEGPCDFEVRSPMLGYLNAGKITADVPRRAFGFAILSPGVDFVDLGTSFGVNVGDNGRTELHVFEGEVLCSQSTQAGDAASDAIHVLANRAMEFASAGGDPSDIAMDAASFSQLIALRRPTKIDAKRLRSDKLALWLSADAAVATDKARRVISWQDIVYGDNQSAEDAVQSDPLARPLLVKDGLHGRPTIRFDGDSDFLLTTPLETTDDQTVVMVCQFSQNALQPRKWGGQILNYDGPPSRYLSNLLEPGVLQIGEPLLEEQFKPTLVSGQVFAGFIGSATVEVGRVDGPEVGVDRPFVLTYVYNYSDRVAELRIDGQSCGASRAYAPQGITSRKIIGRHAWMQNFFHGDLSELLIYNRAMSPDELGATTTYLADKYSIELDGEE